MPFVKDDKNINRSGRPTADKLVNPKSLTGAEIREIDMRKTLRKLKHLNNVAITVLGDLMTNPETTEASRLKASVFVMRTYQEIMDDLDKPIINKNTEVGVDEEDDTPIVSLTVLEGGKK